MIKEIEDISEAIAETDIPPPSKKPELRGKDFSPIEFRGAYATFAALALNIRKKG